MYLIKNAEVYSPDPQGKQDVLIGGGKIIAIAKDISLSEAVLQGTIDGKGLTLVPGFIDAHVHIAGAGGEGGPATRTPELQLLHMLEAGVTTVIGCLGTDGMTRNLESVLMKTKSLKQEGVSAWMFTGAYQVPTPSLLGDVGRDIALIEEVIGVGEIALSDHRSSNPGREELAKLVGHARVGGMLGNKAGIVNIHMGDALDPFRPIYDLVENSELGFKQFYPTHCNRNEHIFEDAKLYGKLGYIDITASAYPFFPDLEIKPSKAIKGFLDEDVPLQHITMTSDGCGSLPHFDEQGKLVQLEMGFPLSVYEEFKAAVQEEKIPFEKVLRIVSTNAADILKLPGKGRIETGWDADLLLLDKDLSIIHLFANGTLMVKNKEIIIQNTYH